MILGVYNYVIMLLLLVVVLLLTNVLFNLNFIRISTYLPNKSNIKMYYSQDDIFKV